MKSPEDDGLVFDWDETFHLTVNSNDVFTPCQGLELQVLCLSITHL